MSNTLTGLIPVIYKGMDIVARERIGLISKVTLDADASMAAVGQAVRSFLTAPSAAVDNTPGSYAPNSGGQVISYNEIQITKSKSVPVQWTGEEVRSVGGQYEQMLANQFAQAFRTLSNLVEADLASAMTLGGSRAFGAVGTTPFATAGDLSDSAGVLKILDDNGAPFQDLSYVANNATMASFRGKQSVLYKVNEAGTAELLRQGTIGNLQGMAIGQSAALSTKHVAGTANAAYVLNGASAVGDTTVAVKTGAGTIVAGDVVVINSVKYVVATDLAAGSFTINKPGVQVAGADGDAVTITASYATDLAFHRGSTILLARQPIMPPGGDMALDVMGITDPVSGITFQVALYRQYRQLHIEIGLAWGSKVIKPEFIALNIQ